MTTSTDEKVVFSVKDAKDVKLEPSPVTSVFTEEAFQIPPQRLKADTKSILDVFYQQSISFDEKNENYTSKQIGSQVIALHKVYPQLPKLYKALRQWGIANNVLPADLANLRERMLEYAQLPSKVQFNSAIIFLEQLYLYLMDKNGSTLKDQKQIYHRFSESIRYCGPGLYIKLEAIFKLITTDQALQELVFKARDAVVDSYSSLYIANKPSAQLQSVHVSIGFNNYAHEQKWGFPKIVDQFAGVSTDINQIDHEKFHRYFLDNHTPNHVIDHVSFAVHVQMSKLVDAYGLSYEKVKRINAAEQESKTLKKMLEKILEYHGINANAAIVARVQGAIPEKFAANLTTALQGNIDEKIITELKLTSHVAEKIKKANLDLKSCALNSIQLNILQQGMLVFDEAAKANLKKWGIGAAWLATIQDPDALHWNPRDNYHLNDDYSRFEIEAIDYFKGLGFEATPSIISLFEYNNLQFDRTAIKAVVLQLIYKDKKIFNANCWQVLELRNGSRFYLFFNSPDEAEVDLFWLETEGVAVSFQQYLGKTPARSLAILLAQLKNPHEVGLIIKGLVSSTNGTLLKSLMTVLSVHLADVKISNAISAQVLGRFLTILLQQNCWDWAIKLLTINLQFDLNAYCDPETGNYALHLAVAGRQVKLVELLCSKGANTLYINHNYKTAVQLLPAMGDEKNVDELKKTLTSAAQQLLPSHLSQAVTQNADYNFTEGVVTILSRADEKIKIDVNQISPLTKRTALHSAVLHENEQLCSVLKEANPTILAGFAKKSVFHYARVSNFESINILFKLCRHAATECIAADDMEYLGKILAKKLDDYVKWPNGFPIKAAFLDLLSSMLDLANKPIPFNVKFLPSGKTVFENIDINPEVLALFVKHILRHLKNYCSLSELDDIIIKLMQHNLLDLLNDLLKTDTIFLFDVDKILQWVKERKKQLPANANLEQQKTLANVIENIILNLLENIQYFAGRPIVSPLSHSLFQRLYKLLLYYIDWNYSKYENQDNNVFHRILKLGTSFDKQKACLLLEILIDKKIFPSQDCSEFSYIQNSWMFDFILNKLEDKKPAIKVLKQSGNWYLVFMAEPVMPGKFYYFLQKLVFEYKRKKLSLEDYKKGLKKLFENAQDWLTFNEIEEVLRYLVTNNTFVDGMVFNSNNKNGVLSLLEESNRYRCFFKSEGQKLEEKLTRKLINSPRPMAMQTALEAIVKLTADSSDDQFKQVENQLFSLMLDIDFICKSQEVEHIQYLFGLLTNVQHLKQGRSWAKILEIYLPQKLAQKAHELATLLKSEYSSSFFKDANKLVKIDALQKFAEVISSGKGMQNMDLLEKVAFSTNVAVSTANEKKVFAGLISTRVKDFFSMAKLVARGLTLPMNEDFISDAKKGMAAAPRL